MAGSSHWSASFSIEADENGLIKSDIACLTKKLISDRFPDSNNQLAADVRPTLFSRARAELDTGSDVIVVIKAIAGDEFSTIEDGIFRVAPLKAAGNFKSKFVRQAPPPSNVLDGKRCDVGKSRVVSDGIEIGFRGNSRQVIRIQV
jgi:hypothetical protein